MPDDQREIVFPQDVPVRILRKEHLEDAKPTASKASQPTEALGNDAEDNLRSDAGKVQEQAEKNETPDNGKVDLLTSSAASPAVPNDRKSQGGSSTPR